MNRKTKLVKLVCAALILATIYGAPHTASAAAPFDSHAAYDVLTHLVVGTNSKSAKKPLSRGIAAALAGVRQDFEYESYSSKYSFFQSVEDGGAINIQSMTNGLGAFESLDNPVFSELSYGGFKIGETTLGTAGFRAFHYQARIPIRYKGIEKNPENVSLVKYETIKISLVNIHLEIGQPKLIGSLPLPENGEMLFFILEVRKPGAE